MQPRLVTTKILVPSLNNDIVPRQELSAHLDGVESELVVKSGHSSQSNPIVVSEVRRILLGHLEEMRSSVALSH